MKKRILKLVPRGALIAIVAVLLICTAALAIAYLYTIPAHMTIIPGPREAKVYADANATIPFPELYWGEVQHGETLQFECYVKNIGAEPITANLSIEQDMSAYFTYTITPENIPLDAGEIGHFVFEAYVLTTAPLGDFDYLYVGPPE